MNVHKTLAVLTCIAIGTSVVGPARAQMAPASSKGAANPSAKTGLRPDDHTQVNLENETKDTKPKHSTSSSISSAPSTDHGNPSDQPVKKSNRAKKRASPLAATPGKNPKGLSAEAAKGETTTDQNPPQKKTP